MDSVKIALAVQGGLSPICACCKKYWRARERSIPGDRCLATDGCGGPLSGDDYHEYEGPVTDFSRWCFACGETSKYGVRVKNRPRIIGVCEKHIHMLATVRPANRPEKDPDLTIRDENGETSMKEVMGPEKKSLFKAIQEVEDHYSKKEGREE